MWSESADMVMTKLICHNSSGVVRHFAQFWRRVLEDLLLNQSQLERRRNAPVKAGWVLGSRGLRLDAQRVNVGVHKVSDSHIDKSMASHGGQARKLV